MGGEEGEDDPMGRDKAWVGGTDLGVEMGTLVTILSCTTDGCLPWVICSSGGSGAGASKGFDEVDDAFGSCHAVGVSAGELGRSWELSSALAYSAPIV